MSPRDGEGNSATPSPSPVGLSFSHDVFFGRFKAGDPIVGYGWTVGPGVGASGSVHGTGTTVLQALGNYIEGLRESCAPPEDIWEGEVRLDLAARFARTQASATVEDAITTTLGVGGAALCGLSLALPTP